MRKIGAITIGQSPRTDVIPDLERLLPPDTEIIQAGVLDGLMEDDIRALEPSSPEKDGAILVSRLKNGNWVRMAENKILPIVQKRIEGLEEKGVSLILMLCTGTFPDDFQCSVPIVFPQKILYGVVPAIAGKAGIVSPDPSQIGNTLERWRQILPSVMAESANPYSGAEGLEDIGRRFAEEGAEACVLDCIGYDTKMKERMERASGLPVVLPRTLVARVISEILPTSYR